MVIFINPGPVSVFWKAAARLLKALCLPCLFMSSQAQDKPDSLQVMFYNVENFFDPFDDTLTRDEEFTPEGSRLWTYSRFMDKAVKIGRVIIACGDPEPPAIIGLAEIENRFVLETLIHETPLNRFDFGIIHKDSPDLRGIDVALLYSRDKIRIDTFNFLHVPLEDPEDYTRDILVARCIIFEKDTLVICVNHWPSRYGGAASSQGKRISAATSLKEHLDVEYGCGPEVNILVMGDFNDEPADPSLQVLSSSEIKHEDPCDNYLVNLMNSIEYPEGTVKYGGFWYIFDQFIVSSALIQGTGGVITKNKKAAIFAAAFLFEADNSHIGGKPFRTFLGPAYHHGFSDHLPVLVTIHKH
jgi:hypothetical protein